MNLDEIITLEPLSGPAVIPTPTEQQPIKYNNMFFLLSCIIVMASSWCCGYNIGLTYIPLKVYIFFRKKLTIITLYFFLEKV